MESRNIDQRLLLTKLTIPPIYRDKVLPLQRLHGQLDIGVQRPLLLVSAPAGFGKTTLIAQWLRQKELLAAWVSLEKADNELMRFWRYVITALGRQHDAICKQVETWPKLPQNFNIETILTSLINALLDLPEEVVLVLDDYQAITDATIHQSMLFLLGHLPPQLHMLIITRADPPLALARLRVQGKLTEIRAADLRLTVDEASTFLNQIMNLSLTNQQVKDLCQRTEGWIAGIQLAALSLNGHHDVSNVQHFIDTFTCVKLSSSSKRSADLLRRGQAPLLQEHEVPLSEMLSGREYAVLRLVSEGLSNQEIARNLVVTVSTVKTHLNNIYAKFHVHTRLQAVTKAYDLGLLSRPPLIQ
jgi:LuxR family transcriptional regulator, maltose regulon positive regulatory protein